MRKSMTLALAISAALMSGAALAQTTPGAGDAAKSAAATPSAGDAAKSATASTCSNPNALGVSRVVQIDTTGGPGFGFEHFKAYDFLTDHEVVLTFDDGPWPGNTERVLQALADQCTRAMFFPIGKHAGYHPEILKKVVEAGHTVGSHTWSHKDLSRLTDDEAKAEIEKGIAAVSVALGNQPIAPFFRFPALKHPPEMLKYVGTRNIGVFSTDMDSFDFTMRRPEQVIKSVESKLEKRGKGIVLMHDFQHPTSEAIATILKWLKDNNYKIVQVIGKTPVEPIPEYKEAVLKEMGGGLDEARPMSSVVKTIGGN